MDDDLNSSDIADLTMPSDVQSIDTAPEAPGTPTTPARAVEKATQQWREEFPYHWRADDLVTRRDTLRFLVAGSGALFASTALLAAAGKVLQAPATGPVAIGRVADLAENEAHVFNFPDQYTQGIVVNLPGKGLVAYSDVCTHLSCAVLYQPGEKQFYCPCHEGHFDAYTGEVLAGPPTRPLPLITLQVRDGIIYAVKEVER